MSKELEALERLTRIHNHDEFKECYGIIETALKRLEIYDSVEKTIEETTPNKCILNDDGSIEIEGADYLMLVPKKEYQKKLKALEIIKKNVKIYTERIVPYGEPEVCNVYLNMRGYIADKEQKEQFDLLKEVLL